MFTNNWQRWLNRTFGSGKQRRRPRPEKHSKNLYLECLEDRLVPTIIYKPVFGVETEKQNDSEHMSQPQVYLTFWGQYWKNNGAQWQKVLAAATKVVTSPFPLITNQYGADGNNINIAGVGFDFGDPSNNHFDTEEIDNVVQGKIDGGTFPESDTFNGDDHKTFYAVVTPPGYRSSVGAQVAGFNHVGTDTDAGDSDDIGEVWAYTGANSDNTVDVDAFSTTFSHEMAELMTDFDQEGYEVNPPPGAPSGSGNQIGDYEGNSYAFRMSNGVDVLSVWSGADSYAPSGGTPGAWAVNDGTNQKFYLDGTGQWNGNTSFNHKYGLTIQGDQNANVDDNITVGTVAGGPQAGGVQVTENGQTVKFDKGQITSILINAKTGKNTINLNPLPDGVTLLGMDSIGGTINLVAPNTPNTWNITGVGSGTLNNVVFSNATSLTGGSNSDAFNFISTGFIQGNINGGGGANSLNYSFFDTVTLNANHASRIVGTFNNIGTVIINDASTVSIGPGNPNAASISVAVNSPNVLTDLTMDDRPDTKFNTFTVTNSAIKCNGFVVSYSPGRTRQLSVLGGTAGSKIFLGSPSAPLDALPATMTVTGGKNSTLVVDGSASADNLYQIDKGLVGAYFHHFVGLRPVNTLTNQIGYSNLSALEIDANSGGTTSNVAGTSAATTTLVGGGADTVNIGSNGSLQKIGGAVFVRNPSGNCSAVNVDDSADATPRTLILYTKLSLYVPVTVISGLTPAGSGDIVLRDGQVSSLTIRAGSPPPGSYPRNNFRIHDTPLGATTSVFTGTRPQNVLIDGTSGVLNLDVQGAGAGATYITVGSATAGLDGINGPVSLTDDGGASYLSIIDGAASVSRNYVMDANSFQRLDKARVGFQNMFQLTVRTAGQFDHIAVQDTTLFAFANTSLVVSGASAEIDVSKTTGSLILGAGGSSVINIGSAASSLDNIQGSIGVQPSAGSLVTLSLDDEATATPQQVDVVTNFFGFASWKRSGAAAINLLTSSLHQADWQSGSGGTILNQTIKVAPLTHYKLANDILTIGTKAGTISNFGSISVTGGVGPDSVILDDSGETRPQTYNVSQVSGDEIFATRGTTVDLGPDIETFEVKGGAGLNTINVAGTIAGMSTILHAGAGMNMVAVGGTADALQAIQGPLTIDSAGGMSTLTFNDQGTTTPENYYLTADLLRREDGFADDMAPISLAGFAAVTLNMGSGTSAAGVYGSAAGSTVIVNSLAGNQHVLAVDASTNAILGPIYFNGLAADFDYVEYLDLANTTPHTYRLTSTSVTRDDQAPVFISGVFATYLFAPPVGGNTVNVTSVATGEAFLIQAANGDHVTVGSLAPGLGGTLAGILDQVSVVSYTATDAVSVVFDDSGNTDTTAKQIIFSGDADGNVSVLGLTPIALSWNLPLTSSVTILGGAADMIFSMQPVVAQTPLTIVAGTGSNTLDYSAYTTDVSVNLQTGTATDLAGITDPATGRVTIQNVIGGSGNDTLTAGADRSILIGGGGTDQLFGGSGEDILIGGTTDYTQPNLLNVAALDAILQEWNRTDLGFDDRMSDLFAGSNALGVPANNVVGGTPILLNGDTVHDDLAADALTGGTGRDWYFIDASDHINNQKPGDKVTIV
jgi:hypothetical protein